MNLLGHGFLLFLLDVFLARICFCLSHHTHRDSTFFFEEKSAGTLMPLPSRWPQTFHFLSISACRYLPLRLSIVPS
ncbi:hypothetical protein EDB89DRAFT_1976181 [Lactarius sanguifluus]|nr:hypothetical protein EDB89DRAFT_1976181 [Lactarius sanguifluus]